MRYAILGMILCLAASGCTTLSSTMIHRKDDDRFVKNGKLPFKGVPMAMQVPTHLDVWIQETYFLANTPNGLEEITLRDTNDSPQRFFEVKTETIKTKKVFTVDFKRPGAGTLKYDLGFNDEQYLNKISNKIEDKTLTDVTAAIQNIAPILAGVPTSAEFGDDLDGKVTEATRDIAYRRFDISSPTFEIELNDFVAGIVSNCNSCRSWSTPVDGIVSSRQVAGVVGLESHSLDSNSAPLSSPTDLVVETEGFSVYSQ